MEAEKKHSSLTIRAFMAQIIAASSSNIIGSAAGHPLDTIKVRMQANTTNE